MVMQALIDKWKTPLEKWKYGAATPSNLLINNGKYFCDDNPLRQALS